MSQETMGVFHENIHANLISVTPLDCTACVSINIINTETGQAFAC